MEHEVKPANRVSIRVEGNGVAQVRLIRSDKMNALDPDMFAAILDALRDKARLAAATDQPLDLMLLRLSSEMHDQLFVHERRLLPVQQVQPVGP